jgi:hypothetical protein
MVPSSVLMSMLDPMADQRAPVLLHLNLLMTPATRFNSSTVMTGKAVHWKSARIDLLVPVAQALVAVVVDSVHAAVLVEDSVEAVVHLWEEAVVASAVELALEAVVVDLEEATQDLQVVDSRTLPLLLPTPSQTMPLLVPREVRLSMSAM